MNPKCLLNLATLPMCLSWPSSRRGLAYSYNGNQRNSRRRTCSSLGSGLRLAHLACYCQTSHQPSPESRTVKSHWEKHGYWEGEKSGPFWQSVYHNPQWQKSPPKDIGIKPDKKMYSTLTHPFNSNTEEEWLGEVFRGEGPFYSDLATPFLCFLRTTTSLGLSFFIYKMVNLHSRVPAALRFYILEYFNSNHLPSSIISLQQSLLA